METHTNEGLLQAAIRSEAVDHATRVERGEERISTRFEGIELYVLS